MSRYSMKSFRKIYRGGQKSLENSSQQPKCLQTFAVMEWNTLSAAIKTIGSKIFLTKIKICPGSNPLKIWISLEIYIFSAFPSLK